MYLRQKYSLAVFLPMLGLFINIIIQFNGIFNILKYLNYSSTDQNKNIFFLFANIGLMILVLILGTILIGSFQVIKLESEGIRNRLLIYNGPLIRWNEIDKITFLQNGYIAINIARSKLKSLNGLSLNRFYGYLLRINQPIILISPKLQHIDYFLQEIHTKSHPQEINKI
jgi:hypothetical protein